MIDITEIADNADVIVNGYAFTADGEIVRVVNLNNAASTAVIDAKEEVIETTMNDVELDIVAGIIFIIPRTALLKRCTFTQVTKS